MADQKGRGPAGDGTKGALAAPTVADQLAAEKAARARQEEMGWVMQPRKDVRPAKPGEKYGDMSEFRDATPKALSKGQRSDLARRIRAKLSRSGKKPPQ